MKRTVSITLIVVLLLAATATVVWADPTEWHVYYPASIQAAVNGASDGDIIYVHDGMYNEAITINGTDVSLIAVGSVTLAPLSCTDHDDVITVYNAVATVDGFEVDASACTSGIYARGCSWLTEGNVAVTIRNNHVHGYFKNGITVNCDLATGLVYGNRVEGFGASPNVAQNGIQFGYGATGKAMDNTVNSHWYTGADWMASGILVFEADDVAVQRNTVKDSQTAVAIESWCWLQPSASMNRVMGNTIQNAEWGVSIAAWDLGPYTTCDPSADNNKVVNNLITTATAGDAGVSIWTGSDMEGGTYAPSADNNKVICNDISGFVDDIADGGTASKLHANTPQF